MFEMYTILMSHPIHHITAIALDPKECVRFYSDILGLRLVKKSVNQDQTEAYHLFFGDKTGEPGMDLTFFTFPGIGPGKRGPGAVSTISLSVPLNSLDFWMKRFEKSSVKNTGIQEKFGAHTITFFDKDEQRLELVGLKDEDLKKIKGDVWQTPEVAANHAIRCFDSAKLSVMSSSMITPVVTQILGYKKIDEKERVSLYAIDGVVRGGYLEIEEHPDEPPVINAAGTVHHIAFQVADRAELLKKREEIIAAGLYPTDVIDRYYFKSVYFRTPAGILFELATRGPGFTVDEAEEVLGKKLALPPFLEAQRTEIERLLEPID